MERIIDLNNTAFSSAMFPWSLWRAKQLNYGIGSGGGYSDGSGSGRGIVDMYEDGSGKDPHSNSSALKGVESGAGIGPGAGSVCGSWHSLWFKYANKDLITP